jgi:hypothetical protein
MDAQIYYAKEEIIYNYTARGKSSITVKKKIRTLSCILYCSTGKN